MTAMRQGDCDCGEEDAIDYKAFTCKDESPFAGGAHVHSMQRATDEAVVKCITT